MSPFMLCFGGSWRDTGQGDGLFYPPNLPMR